MSVSISEKKAWLNQARETQTELQALRESREQIYADATSITGKVGGAVISGSRRVHRYDALVEVDDFIKAQEKTLIKQRSKLLKAIYSLEDTTIRTVFTYRYVTGLYWNEIAEKINYSEPRVHAFHNRGLEQINITPGMIESMRAAHGC